MTFQDKTIQKTDNELKTKIETLKTNLDNLQQTVESTAEMIEKLERDKERINTQLKERDKIEEAFILGRKITGTTSGTAGTQTTHPHYLGRSPKFVFITPTSNGVVYLSASADKTNIYVKGSAASLTFDAYVLI